LFNREFELVNSTNCWGERRVYFYDDNGKLSSLPASWTSAAAPDPFVTLSAGRSFLHVKDLLNLSTLIQDLVK
jgi:hypothetical protein